MKAERALADVAASVADGASIDWDAIESRVDAHERRLVRHLRLVDSISTLYRTIPAEAGDDALDERGDGPLWGRLVLRERIGQGTSCDVYRAWDSGLHRDVALKLLHDESATRDAHGRILQEARRLARVRHPHVVQVYGAEEHDGRVGLWMELVQGESLEQVVRNRGPFGPREAGGVAQELCAALAAVHAAGLLHRDVKAQNVVRENGGRIVLMDFGTGEELRSNVGSARLIGTPLYLAPEIFAGHPASVQSDIYSLGVLLFYLATGQFPVVAGTMEQLANAHASGTARRLRDIRPDLPAPFVRAVECALEREPSRRYRTAGEMEAALEQAARVPVVAGPVEARPAWWRVPAVLAVSLLLVVSLIVWTRGRGQTSAVAPGSIDSIAVLPLVDVSESPSPWLADALTEQVIATLGQVQSLRVTSRSSVTSFKGTSMSLGEIAKRLGVDAVVEGSVAVARPGQGEGVARVNARLIAAGTDRLLWSRTFERPVSDALALQSDVASGVADAVHATMTPDEAARLAKRPQFNPAAEEAYVQGRLHLAEYGPSAARRSLEAFQRAMRLDANHAPAHAGAALAYLRLGNFGAMALADARQSGLAEARRALALDDNVPEAHAALGDIEFWYNWDFASAEREYLRSLELNGSYAYARTQYAQLLAGLRRFDDAIAQSGAAVALNPESGEALRVHGLSYYYKRDYASAEDILERALAREPDSAGAHTLLARVAEDRQDYARALDLARRAAQLSDGGGVALQVTIIRLQALSGDQAGARGAFAALQQQAADRSITLTARDIAYVHLAFGDYDRACRAFERALDDRDPSLVWITVDPRVDVLRERADFRAIVDTILRQ